MSDEAENLVLIYLRRLDAKMDKLGDDMRDIKVRLSATEEAIARQSGRIDRMDFRLERIERQLDLIPAG